MNELTRLRQRSQRLWSILPALGIVAWGLYTRDALLLKFLLAGVVIGLCIIGLNRLLLPFSVRKILLTIHSPPRYLLTSLDDFRGLDTTELECLTREWQHLDFVPIGDYSIQALAPAPNSPSLFVRFLEHESGAILQIIQLPSPGPLPFVFQLQSFWGESEREPLLRQSRQRFGALPSDAPLAEPNPTAELALSPPIVPDLKIWSLLTYNASYKRARSRYAEFLRHPRVLRCRLDGSATPAQLWQAHQEHCALIEARLGEPTLKGHLLPLFCAHHEALSAFISSRLKAATPRDLWKSYYARDAPASPFFDGELAPLDASN